MILVTNQDWWKPCLAEALGTFALIFIGAGSVIALHHVGLGVGGDSAAFFVGVALAHGLAIAVMITGLGHLSGGHFNPAVTIATLFTRKMHLELGVLYIVFQLLGALFGAFLLLTAFPTDWWEPVNLGTPGLLRGEAGAIIDPAKGVLIEAVLTFFLVLVIFGVGLDSRNQMKPVAGLAIGLTITMDILLGGPLTGAAMNPARAFAPALLSRTWTDQYVYWAGPILGAIIAGLVYDSAWLQARPAKSDSTTAESAGGAPETPKP